MINIVCEDNVTRPLMKGNIYKHFKGHIVEILEPHVVNTETKEHMVVYREISNGNVWARPIEMFTSKVDKEKYPNVEQEYRFELIGTIGQQ